MSRWEEQFNEHPIHENLEYLREKVSKEFDDVDEEEIPEKRRFLKLISLYQDTLKKVDPEIIPFQQLDSLNNTLVSAELRGPVDAYNATGKVTNLVSANNIISNQLAQMAILSAYTSGPDHLVMTSELQALTDSSIGSLVEKKDNLLSEFDALEKAIAQKEEQLKSLESNFASATDRLGSVVNEWQAQFSAAQELRSEKYLEWRDKFTEDSRAEIDTIIRGAEHDLNEAAEKFENDIHNLLTEGQSTHGKILEIYELTAGDSVGAGYINSANTEGAAANRWRLLSVVFIVATVVFLWTNFKHITDMELVSSAIVQTAQDAQENDGKGGKKDEGARPEVTQGASGVTAESHFPWYKILLTFSLTGVLLWGSAYSAQQSTKHRRNEKRAKWFALEMKAIDPFISSFDDDTKMEIKKELSSRMFGKAYDLDDDHDKIVDEHMLNSIVEAVVDKVKDIKLGG